MSAVLRNPCVVIATTYWNVRIIIEWKQHNRDASGVGVLSQYPLGGYSREVTIGLTP